MHDRHAIYGNGNGQSGSHHKLTGHICLHNDTIQLCPYRYDSYRHNICMVSTCYGKQCNWRGIRHRPKHTQWHINQYDGWFIDRGL